MHPRKCRQMQPKKNRLPRDNHLLWLCKASSTGNELPKATAATSDAAISAGGPLRDKGHTIAGAEPTAAFSWA